MPVSPSVLTVRAVGALLGGFLTAERRALVIFRIDACPLSVARARLDLAHASVN
jgi:hypothetical protein